MDRKKSLAADCAGAGRGQLRRLGGNRAAVFPEVDYRAGRRIEALYALAFGRTRYLCARGLLQLPLANDPTVPRRDRTLWPLFGGGRICVRPAIPMGLQ